MNAQKWYNIIFMVVFAVVIAFFVFFNNGSKNYGYPMPSNNSNIKLLKVEVKGEVGKPGIFSLEADKRISDAIALAGGTTDRADTSSLNLVAFIKDGQSINVPAKYYKKTSNTKEQQKKSPSISKKTTTESHVVEKTPPKNKSTPQSSPALSDDEIMDNGVTFRGSVRDGDNSYDAALVILPNGSPRPNNVPFVLNVNKADKDALCKIPSLTPEMAVKIVDYRNQHGDYKRVREVMKIEGMSESLYWEIANYLKVKD